MNNEKVLVTGAAGFIGSAVSMKLLLNGYKVLGIDNLNDYYSTNLKIQRLNLFKNHIEEQKNWRFEKISIEDEESIENIFKIFQPNIVINLAAQAGVRYSIENPKSYVNSNLVGFASILEMCRKYPVKNFIYASSSSVYGGNKNKPFSEIHKVDNPISLYAATKKSNELMAHAYSHLYGIPSTGLRFFTVYGPWGRPDMAPMIFSKAILSRKPINIYNFGHMSRDFTYIDDVVKGVFGCCKKPASPYELNKVQIIKDFPLNAPHRIFNIGNGKPINLMRFIEILEENFGIKAIKNYEPMQPGDVEETYADTQELFKWIGFSPETSLEEGLKIFSKWYLNFYKENFK